MPEITRFVLLFKKSYLMTQVENYKYILEKIFNESIKFSNNQITNNCIGAIQDQKNFEIFSNNFIARLHRINSYFSNSPDHIKEVINTAKQIGQTKGYKWAGAYSELVALDYWIQFENITNIKFPDRGRVESFPDSIAKKIDQQEIDIDISLDLNTKKIFSDVKSMIPTHMELTDLIVDRLKSNNSKNYLIGIDDVYDVDYLRTKSDLINEIRKGFLLQELNECINQNKKYHRKTLRSGQNIAFRISYPKPGKNNVLTTTRVLDPYKLANDYKYKVLDYYNKLLVKEPSLLTFVINPWFNSELNMDKQFLRVFLRSLSRRVFIELVKDETDLEKFFPELTGKKITIAEVAKKISGIIFIYDESILKEKKDINDVYIYLNPNATNRVLKERDFDILRWSPEINQPFIDDFTNDNY